MTEEVKVIVDKCVSETTPSRLQVDILPFAKMKTCITILSSITTTYIRDLRTMGTSLTHIAKVSSRTQDSTVVVLNQRLKREDSRKLDRNYLMIIQNNAKRNKIEEIQM